MAQINQIITIGIGTPGDIEHFILVGLSASSEPPGFTTDSSRFVHRFRNGWIYPAFLFAVNLFRNMLCL